MSTLYVKRVVEPANQELASTATPEPIHNNTDITEIDESTTSIIIHVSVAFVSVYALNPLIRHLHVPPS